MVLSLLLKLIYHTWVKIVLIVLLILYLLVLIWLLFMGVNVLFSYNISPPNYDFVLNLTELRTMNIFISELIFQNLMTHKPWFKLVCCLPNDFNQLNQTFLNKKNQTWSAYVFISPTSERWWHSCSTSFFSQIREHFRYILKQSKFRWN